MRSSITPETLGGGSDVHGRGWRHMLETLYGTQRLVSAPRGSVIAVLALMLSAGLFLYAGCGRTVPETFVVISQ